MRKKGTLFVFVSGFLLVLVGSPILALAIAPPVTTLPATFVSDGALTATLSVDAGTAKDAVVWFEWGINQSNPQVNETKRVPVGSGIRKVEEKITGLSANTDYFFRGIGMNSEGKYTGGTVVVRTAPLPKVNQAITVISTKPATFVEETSVLLNGYQSPHMSEGYRWFEWGKSQNLENSTKKTSLGNISQNFTEKLTSLDSGVVYYFRAVSEDASGRRYGAILSFTTLTPRTSAVNEENFSAPVVITKPASFITEKNALVNALIDTRATKDTLYWFEWGFFPESGTPFETPHVSLVGKKDVSVTLQGLAPETAYFFRPVAQNAYGKTKGNSFTVVTRPLPATGDGEIILRTQEANFISSEGARLNAYVSPHGTLDTYRWFEWGDSSTLGFETSHKKQGEDSGFYADQLDSLTPGTLYYFRAVAEDSFGKRYGILRSFQTEGVRPEGGNGQTNTTPGIFGGLFGGNTNSGTAVDPVVNGCSEKKVNKEHLVYQKSTPKQLGFFDKLLGTPSNAVEVDFSLVTDRTQVTSTNLVVYTISYRNTSASPLTSGIVHIDFPSGIIQLNDDVGAGVQYKKQEDGSHTVEREIGNISSGASDSFQIYGVVIGREMTDVLTVSGTLGYLDSQCEEHILSSQVVHNADAGGSEKTASGLSLLPKGILGWFLFLILAIVGVVGGRKAVRIFHEKKEMLRLQKERELEIQKKIALRKETSSVFSDASLSQKSEIDIHPTIPVDPSPRIPKENPPEVPKSPEGQIEVGQPPHNLPL